MIEHIDTLIQWLREEAGPEAMEWLDVECAAVARDPQRLADAFAEAGRRVGRGPLLGGRRTGGTQRDDGQAPPTAHTTAVAQLGAPNPAVGSFALRVGLYDVPLRPWRRVDAARAALVEADGRRLGGDSAATLHRLAQRYWRGDADEKISAVRLFGWLPAGQPQAPLPAPPVLASPPAVGGHPADAFEALDDGPTHALRALLDAFRTSVVPLFDAATAANPFFSAATPELEFNKAVLKRVFVDLPLEPVLGLQARANAELSRMLLHLAHERMVSLRPYPPLDWPTNAGQPTPGLLPTLLGLLEHPDDQLREPAAQALAILGDSRARPYLEDRLPRESREAVRSAIQQALARLHH